MELLDRACRLAFASLFLAAGCRSSASDVAPPRAASPTPPARASAPRAAAPPIARAPAPVASAGSAADTPSHASSRTLRFGDATHERALAPIFPDTLYDTAIPTPDSMLRQPLGTFTAHHAEIVSYLRALDAASSRVHVEAFGRTHEGRELVWAAIGSPANIARLDAIRADLAQLADPRATSAAELERIVESSPAVAWRGYSIHGDEMSGSDAALAVAHHFAAGTSADVTELLEHVVVVIDPCLNPDGRERILSQLEQGAGYVPNLDMDSMNKGRWPYGRGNHYLFDMNRDWVFGTQPETRARWAAIQSFHPQLFVDAHEMGAQDSFLFYPATDPLNPHFPRTAVKWWKTFGDEQAAVFDRHGWSYYTREWADSWYVGYSDSWGTFVGAIGILYEQARFMGQSVRRASGEIATYRDAVHRQAASSVANVATLARNRGEILRDYLAAKQRNVSADAPGNTRMFVLVPGKNVDREATFVDRLIGQGIEVYTSDQSFIGRNVETTLRGKQAEQLFAAGCVIVPARQPLAPLVLATLEFDPRYDTASLVRERKELERKQRSKSYDVTAWSPAHGYDLDAYWCDALDLPLRRVEASAARVGGVVPPERADDPVYGWVVDGAPDSGVVFAARALDLGVQVQIADEPFRAAGQSFPRWSLLVRRHENAADVAERVARAAVESGAQVFATSTARSRDDGPDLGGQHFQLLARPRVALLSNAPIGTDSFGHTWHLIDAKIGLPCTLIDAPSLGSYDLRRYNVLVVPEAYGDFATILKENADALRTWVKSGGTLIASGSAAAALCNEDLELSSVRLRQNALEDLAKIATSVKREREAGDTPIDEALVWGDALPAANASAATDVAAPADVSHGKADASKANDEGDRERHDQWLRTFSPRGALLRGEVDPDAWLTAGAEGEVAVFFDSSNVFLSERPVRTPVRLADKQRLRVSGLVWPEARERIADSAYATVESMGAGQVILFAASPDFRDWFPATARFLANAIVYGPGAGARQPVGW